MSKERFRNAPATAVNPDVPFGWVVLKYRRPLIVLCHLGFAVISNYLAFLLRFDGALPHEYTELFLRTLPFLIVIRGVTFIPFKLYQGLWRYTGIWDLCSIVGGVTVSSANLYILVRWGFGLAAYPRSVLIIDAMLLVILVGGVRLGRRVYRELRPLAREKRILIYGAGDAGEMIVRDMKNNPFHEYEPIGFVDDDVRKVGQRIHGAPVLGTRQDLGRIFADYAPDVVLVAMPRVGSTAVREIVKSLESFKAPIKTLPNLRNVLDGTVTMNHIRDLSIDDLLERSPIGLDYEPIRHLISGKRVLVTGAAGSVGAELCRQIASLAPSGLVLYDRHENGMHEIADELAPRQAEFVLQTVIGDVADAQRIDVTIAAYRPDIIFHAAAYKHVPIMEFNPCEAVKNNVLGTRIVAEAALRHDVERFILISTDKAVNPSSVMGMTKRVAEWIVESLHMSRSGNGIFALVRFGNVLGSNGSVVPLFLKQIKSGGPVTVTHPEMRRYFMLIPEAVQLVLHAAALAKGGETFVLDMGEQIKVVDMARNLIRLSGFLPDEEIPIKFIGMRPGEKLYEELADSDETMELPAAEKIFTVRPTWILDPEALARSVAKLERLAVAGDAEATRALLTALMDIERPRLTE